MIEKGTKVKIKSPTNMLLPGSGQIHCPIGEMPGVWIVWLNMPYYGLNMIAINESWLTEQK